MHPHQDSSQGEPVDIVREMRDFQSGIKDAYNRLLERLKEALQESKETAAAAREGAASAQRSLQTMQEQMALHAATVADGRRQEIDRLVTEVVAPVFDLLYDASVAIRAAQPVWKPDVVQSALAVLRDRLEQSGIEIVEPAVGAPLDLASCKAADSVRIRWHEFSAKEGTVAQVVRCGFAVRDSSSTPPANGRVRVIRQAMVVVYRRGVDQP